jgi:Raf kinase inhibitor-like YbhB/YbcL family protein
MLVPSNQVRPLLTEPGICPVVPGGSLALKVVSPAFSHGEPIPAKYTCDGENISPPLEWTGIPRRARSIAVICDDPDAPSGLFTHWVLYDVNPSVSAVAEGSSAGGKEGVNDFDTRGYSGPCPPTNGPHRYFFHVFALDVPSLGRPGLRRREAVDAMQGHVLAHGELMGRYRRK